MKKKTEAPETVLFPELKNSAVRISYAELCRHTGYTADNVRFKMKNRVEFGLTRAWLGPREVHMSYPEYALMIQNFPGPYIASALAQGLFISPEDLKTQGIDPSRVKKLIDKGTIEAAWDGKILRISESEWIHLCDACLRSLPKHWTRDPEGFVGGPLMHGICSSSDFAATPWQEQPRAPRRRLGLC